MKKLLLLLIISTFPRIVNAYDFAVENDEGITFYYERFGESEGNVMVVRGEIQYEGDILIPSTVTYEGVNYAVTKIGDQAFMGFSDIISITMPASITIIGTQAFDSDLQLTSVSFSENIKTIGESAFSGCKALKKVVLPPLLTYLDKKVFQNCSELEEIVLPSSLKTINNSDYDNSNPFGGCTKLKKVVVENLESWLSITLYGSTQPFYDYHLYLGEEELKDLVIPIGITSINNNAFRNCTGLESITIPNHVTSIGRNAFNGCGKIKALNIEGSTTSFGSYALSGLYPQTIRVPSIDYWMNSVSPNIMANGNSIFRYDLYVDGGLVENLVIPDGVTTVQERAFSGCTSLKTLSFSYTTTSIGYLAFGYCSGLESVTIRNGIASLGESAFSSCENLKTIVLPSSIAEISPFCFSGCTSLKTIDIPNGVTRICGSAFSGCTSLEEVNIPNSVTEIGGDYNSYDNWKENRVFFGCTSLQSIEIPNSVEYIGSFSFYQCSNLTTVKLSDNLKYISRQCFQDCEKLKYVTIGSNTESISYGAFWGCNSLQEVFCYALNPPTAITTDYSTYQSSFKGVNLSNVKLYVPSSSIETYQATSPWAAFNEIKPIIDGESIPQCAKPTISIVDGLLNFTSETEGVTFNANYNFSGTNVNSVGNQLKLSTTTTCHVSVYATKEDYRDSDIATVEVELSVGKSGDTNQDGVVSIADAVNVVNIIFNKGGASAPAIETPAVGEP